MTRAHHTHGCPKCGVVTVYRCHGRDAGAPDCPSVCEYEVDAGEFDLYCEDCYDEAMNEMEREQREEAEALKPFRPVGVEP